MIKFDAKGFYGLYPVYYAAINDDTGYILPRGFSRLYQLYLWCCFFPMPLMVTGDMPPIYIDEEDLIYVE